MENNYWSYNKFLIVVILYSLILSVKAQNQTVFNKTYNYYNHVGLVGGGTLIHSDEFSHHILVTDDGFLLGGTIDNILFNPTLDSIFNNALIIRTDLQGDTICQKEYNKVNDKREGVLDFIQIENSTNYLVSGYIEDSINSTGNDFDGFIAKMDNNGDFLKDTSFSILERDLFVRLRHVNGSSYMLSRNYDLNPIYLNSCFYKVDTFANVSFLNCFSNSINNYVVENFFEINSTLFVTTTVNNFDSNLVYPAILAFDTFGNFIDSIHFPRLQTTALGGRESSGFYLDDDGYHIIQVGFQEVNSNDRAAYILSTDLLGNIDFERTINYGPESELFVSCEVLQDGRTVAISSREDYFGGGYPLCWMVMFDKQGEIIWERELKAYDDDVTHTYPYTVKSTNDKGFAVTGYVINNEIQTNGVYHRNDAWLCKTDSCGFSVGAQPQASFTIDSVIGNQVYISNLSDEYCIANMQFSYINSLQNDTSLLDSLHIYAYSQFTNGDDPNQLIYTLPDTGNYFFQLTTFAGDTFDIFSSSINVADTSTSIGGLQENLTFNIYPNPTKDNIIVQLSASSPKASLGEIYTMDGRKVLDFTIDTNLLHTKIELPELQAGVYLVKISDDSGKSAMERITIL